MSYERTLMEAENLAHCVMTVEGLRNSKEGKEYFKPIDAEELDEANLDSQRTASASKEHVIERLPDAYARHPEPAQETEEERYWRQQQIDYERGSSYAKNNELAISINSLAKHNFTNRILAAACDFTEMAENHPRSIFIQNFGPLIEEELKSDPSKPSKRLASFATTYFWKEANWRRMEAASFPSRHKIIERDELLEFFKLPLNSEPDKKVIDFLYPQVLGRIIEASGDENNKDIQFTFRKEVPYIPMDEASKLEKSFIELSQQNFTNRILSSTSHFAVLCNPFNNGRTMKDFARDLEKELKSAPDKASPRLVTLMTENAFKDEDIKKMIEGVTPKTTKEELREFFTTRENWSTGLRMIDYLNHYVVTEMTRFLPEQDRLEIWNLRPEMINGTHAGGSLKKLSPESQKKLLDTVADPVRKKAIREDMINQLIGLHVSFGLRGGGNINPDTLDIFGQFADIRKRRICSHDDNKRFFPTQEHFRSAY